jgi:hypothetical protein
VAKNLTGIIANTSLSRAQTVVSRALSTIFDECDWSWSKGFAGWLAPGVVFQNGSFTTTPYSNQIIADATATALLTAYTGQPLITQLQYRNPGYAIYSIVGYDYNTINTGFVTLTLDRPWMEPTSGPGQPYMIYQVYFPSPVQDFRKFVAIQDMTNDQDIDFWSKTQAMLAIDDSQRQNFSNPEYCVPAGVDLRPGSATYGWPWFELWPHQGSYVPYTLTFRRKGQLPQTTQDYLTMTTPYPITEEMVEWRAREILCQDAEASKDKNSARGSGANWLMLAQMAQKEYRTLFEQVLSIDLNLDGEAFAQTDRHRYDGGSPFATMSGGINLGGYNSKGS